MTDWEKFWQEYRITSIESDSDLLYQAGKTVAGNVIDRSTFEILVRGIISLLNLKGDDNLLDLCCGNGIVTYELSKVVNHIIGIDFSNPFFENANRFKSGNNIQYISYDVKRLIDIKAKLIKARINKVLLYDGLAYFNKEELNTLINLLGEIGGREIKILLGSVLDNNKKWNFFNSARRKLNYLVNMKLLGNTKGVGTWWRMQDITAICEAYGFNYSFVEQNPSLYTSHYRIDILIYR